MSNSESLDNIVNKKNNTNIITHNMGSNDVINALNIKALIGLFVIFILITNNIFTENILSKIKGTYNGTRLTVVGIIVQSIIMIILYIALLFLIKYEIV
jgi:hypothetical protein